MASVSSPAISLTMRKSAGPERMRTGAFNDQDTGCLGHLAEWDADLAPDLGHDGDVIGIGIDVGNQLANASPGHATPDPGIDVEPPQRMLVADLMDEGDSARVDSGRRRHMRSPSDRTGHRRQSG